MYTTIVPRKFKENVYNRKQWIKFMYTTVAPRKFKENVYNRKQWIKFGLLMKRKYATQSGNLNSTTHVYNRK